MGENCPGHCPGGRGSCSGRGCQGELSGHPAIKPSVVVSLQSDVQTWSQIHLKHVQKLHSPNY